MEVLVETPDGTKAGNTAPVETAKPTPPAMRRVTQLDLNGPLGEFFADALPQCAPDVFDSVNWKPFISSMANDNKAFFAVQGRTAIIATCNKDPMMAYPTVTVRLLLVASEGDEKDAYDLARACKRWARDLKAEMVLPKEEFCNILPYKLKDALGAKSRTFNIVAPLGKSDA